MGPRQATGNSRRLAIGLGTGAALVGALAYVGIGDPHSPGFVFLPCPFKALTGWNCPACGGLRMTHDVLHGDFAAAVTDNVFLLIGLPLLAAFILTQRARGRKTSTPALLATVITAAVVWTVARNMPGFPLEPTLIGG
jgi:hypothetical protein